ncbi:hypothetical protein [Bacillus sp. 165]|uniref:hypothetical protein n=1 Tax=Bacillus sp. 165 TaxID=1529117 RepID=UPI001AD99BAC|nr:hypothetical protein [Bacillus sp. 165]MBO9129659.1 hypothetical protein [Bacillus sp. 165]
MTEKTALKIIHELNKFGFDNVEYHKGFKNFYFQNDSDFMNNYVTITYSDHFKRFNVQVHPMETANITELEEVTKRIYKLTQCIAKLNTILEQDETQGDSKLVI